MGSGFEVSRFRSWEVFAFSGWGELGELLVGDMLAEHFSGGSGRYIFSGSSFCFTACSGRAVPQPVLLNIRVLTVAAEVSLPLEVGVHA